MLWRKEKINELLKERIAELIFKSLTFPDNPLVTITKAEIAKRGRAHAKIYVSVLPDEKGKEVLKILEDNIYKLQKSLDKQLFMRPVPKIRFLLDRQGEYFSKISRLLKKSGS